MGLFNFKRKKKETSDKKNILNASNSSISIPLPPERTESQVMGLKDAMKSNKKGLHTDLLDLNIHNDQNISNELKSDRRDTEKRVNPPLINQNKTKINISSFNEKKEAEQIVPDVLPDLDIPTSINVPKFDEIDKIGKEILTNKKEESINKEPTQSISMVESGFKKNKFIEVTENQKHQNKIELSIRDLNRGLKRIDKLNSIKDSKDFNYEKYREELEDIERKLVYLDRVLFNETLY